LILGVIAAAVSALALAASAAGVGTGTTTAFAELFFNSCTGEWFVAEGTVKTSVDATIGTDGRVHERWHVNLQARTAKGVITGVKYIAQQSLNQGLNADIDAAPSTQHYIFKEHYVRAGEDGTLFEDDDFYLYFHMHVTINSNGVPTVERIETDDDVCR
jgi:hypothetical protein